MHLFYLLINSLISLFFFSWYGEMGIRKKKKCILENFIYKILGKELSVSTKAETFKQSYSQLMNREAEAQKMTLFAQGCMGKPVKEKGIGCASVVSSPNYSGSPFVHFCPAKCIASVNLTLL